MNVKKLVSILLIIFLLVISTGCSNTTDDTGHKKISDPNSLTEDEDNIDLYSLTENEDNTYSYSFTDLNGNILFKKENVVRKPKINVLSGNIYELITQTGTGLSTNWAVYCDVENSKTSEIYYYVLGAKENYVIFANFKNEEHFIVVQEIFDEGDDRYYKEYKLENVSPVAADFTTDCKFDDHGNAIVTYLTGDDYTENKLTIVLP